MKRFLLVAIMGAGLSATAQQQPMLKKLEFPVKPGVSINADTTGELFKNLPGLIQQRSLLPQATYSHTTSRGKVYNLPIDNMPCLVPDMNQVRPMPQRVMPGSRMPNAIPQQPIIPQEKREKENDK